MWTIIWNYLKLNNRWAIALVIVLLVIFSTIIYLENQKIFRLNETQNTEINMRNALSDSVKYYQNRHNEVVAEKLTIQDKLNNLQTIYSQLSNSQKELISRISQMTNSNNVISAALIAANTKIDSLLIVNGNNGNIVNIDTTKQIINFNNLATKDTSFVFDIDINKVLPINKDIKPTLLFKSIQIPNKQFIEFHWKNDKKEGYPISCTITNTNKYIKVINLDSYAIPTINKEHLNPTGWQKIGNFFIKNNNTIVYFSFGAFAGAGGLYLLSK